MKQALTQRGERGVRISDLEYKRGHLELGMLKGNAFIITLRYGCLLACRGPYIDHSRYS